LLRLSIMDEDRPTWVAKSQGTRQAGQRDDPDMGMDVRPWAKANCVWPLHCHL